MTEKTINVKNALNNIHESLEERQLSLVRLESKLEDAIQNKDTKLVLHTEIETNQTKCFEDITAIEDKIKALEDQLQTGNMRQSEIMDRGMAYFNTGLKHLKRVTYKDLVNIKNTVNVPEDLKRII